MVIPEKLSKPKAYLITFLKWGLFGLLMGALGGLLGAGFHHALHFVTHLRAEHNWLIFLLPAGVRRCRDSEQCLEILNSGRADIPHWHPHVLGVP